MKLKRINGLWLFAALIAWAGLAYAQTGTPQTKSLLNTETQTNFPDNTSGLITPLLTRQSMVDYIASWQQAARVNAQTVTSYVVTVDDYGKLVTTNNVSAVTVTIPQATGTFSTFNAYFCNVGAGSATLTPTTSTINGAATLVLATGQCVQAVSDGTNYQIFPGPPPPTTAFNEPGLNNCSLAATVGASVLTVALKDAAGNDPSAGSKCQIAFRSSTASTGTLTIDNVSAALSVNTNAVGATLGSVNNQAFRFWVVAFDNAGTVALGLYNATSPTAGSVSCKAIDETSVQSSTNMSGGSTAAQTFYTNGALSNKAVKILGYVEYNSTGLATAGTYASAPSFINVFGTGSKRPCDPVQIVSTTPSPNATSASATFVVTTMTVTLTPASAANIVWATASATCMKNTAGTGSFEMSRGNTNNTNMIGGLASINSNGGVLLSCAIEAMDFPNTNAAQIYAVQEKSNDANTANWGNSLPAFMRAMEIMG
jgi:hypothetical protein